MPPCMYSNLALTRCCTKCHAPTDRVGVDPVSGEVGIPLCPNCASGDMSRLLLLVATICVALVWIL